LLKRWTCFRRWCGRESKYSNSSLHHDLYRCRAVGFELLTAKGILRGINDAIGWACVPSAAHPSPPDLFAVGSTKFIGVFNSEEKAADSLRRHATLEGFTDAPEGFAIHRIELDSLLANPIEIWE
jgi:hypothetical protein